MSLSRQSIALIVTTKNKQTKHHVHPKQKRQIQKPAVGNNKLRSGLVCLLQLQPGIGPVPIPTTPEPIWGITSTILSNIF